MLSFCFILYERLLGRRSPCKTNCGLPLSRKILKTRYALTFIALGLRPHACTRAPPSCGQVLRTRCAATPRLSCAYAHASPAPMGASSLDTLQLEPITKLRLKTETRIQCIIEDLHTIIRCRRVRRVYPTIVIHTII